MLHSAFPILSRALALAVGLAASTDAVSAERWRPVGPTGVGMVTTMAAGRTAVYAATCNGVYRSDDHGSSWRQAGLPRECVIGLAVDPRPGADTLYAILDPRYFVSYHPEPSFMALSGLFVGSTLWVSGDGGQTWSQTSVPSGNAVVVDSSQPATAYVANYDANYAPLAVTHDSGATWARVTDSPNTTFLRLASDPRDGTLYAAGVSLSIYSGGSWSALAIRVNVVAAGSGSDGAVYAAGRELFCRKTNAVPWNCTYVPGIFSPLQITEIPASESQPARVLLGSFQGLWSSDDGGATFSRAATDVTGSVSAAAIDPAGTPVYIGNDTGVYRSADRGGAWTNSSAGLRSTWVRALAIDPADPSTIWAGAEGRIYDLGQTGPGIFRSTDGGESWIHASVDGEPGYVFSLGLDPSDRENIYTGSFGRVHRTSDGGVTWSSAQPVNGFVHALAVDPVSSRIWAGSDQTLTASGDGGETWSTVLSRSVFALLFDSRHPARIYAGEAWAGVGFDYPYGVGFAVETSRDGGASWNRAGSEQEGAVTALATDPFSDDVVYAATAAGSVLRSSDAGATWERWDTQIDGYSIWALAADPVRPGNLYLGGWGGVYRSQDGGRTWGLFSEGLSPYGAFGLAVSPDGTWLYAGTNGGGVFRRNLFAFNRQTPNPVSRIRTPRIVPQR